MALHDFQPEGGLIATVVLPSRLALTLTPAGGGVQVRKMP